MAKESEKLPEKAGKTTGGEKKKGFNFKVLLIGLPLFIVQLVAVYFITANMLISKLQPASDKSAGADSTLTAELPPEKDEANSKSVGAFIVPIKDVIVNPKNSGGQHYLMVNLGIDVDTPEHQKMLEERSIIIKDLLLNYLSSKTLNQLTATGFKEELKNTLKKSIKKLMKEIKVNNIYFSKYIVN